MERNNRGGSRRGCWNRPQGTTWIPAGSDENDYLRYGIEVGQTVAWNMSFIEQEGPEINEKYISNIDARRRRQYDLAPTENIEEE